MLGRRQPDASRSDNGVHERKIERGALNVSLDGPARFYGGLLFPRDDARLVEVLDAGLPGMNAELDQ